MSETITALEKRVTDASAEAAAIIIRDQDSLTRANAISLGLKALIKEIDETFEPIYKKAKETTAQAKETWDRYRIPPDTEYRRIKSDIGSFLVEQDRLKREAEHRVWMAEQEKIKAEADARRVAEEALRKAAIAEANGQNEKAERILNRAAAQETKISEKIEAATVTAAVPIPIRAQTVGISAREDWDIELLDISMVPREYLIFDKVKARRVIRASKGLIQIPGVKNVKKTIVSQR
ncbi:MAG: hypothetical protein NTV82_01125 [Candidatus Aminicenantes bacterium]|nr:hypothetical protein [Candidatus Aminicenantes bacterium]